MLWADLYAGIAGYANIRLARGNLALKGAQSLGGTVFGAGATLGLVAVYDAAF